MVAGVQIAFLMPSRKDMFVRQSAKTTVWLERHQAERRVKTGFVFLNSKA